MLIAVQASPALRITTSSGKDEWGWIPLGVLPIRSAQDIVELIRRHTEAKRQF